jgi:hypothetical protein
MLQTKTTARVVAALVSAALLIQAPLAGAAIVETDAMTAQSQIEQDRATVQGFVERADVKAKLQAMGVAGLMAKERVGAMSEQEIHALAEKIDTMPAGAQLATMDWVLIVLVALLIVVIL